jgi:hypothetical protein
MPPDRGAVRGLNSDGFGWYLQCVEGADAAVGTSGAEPHNPAGATRVHYVIHSDLRGWLPHAAVNAAMVSTFVNFAAGLRAYLRRQNEAGAAQAPA